MAIEWAGWPNCSVTHRTLQQSLWEAARSLLGDVGSVDLDLKVMRCRESSGQASSIIRTTNLSVAQAKAVVATVTTIDGHPVKPRIRGISGTIRACEEKYIRPDPESLEENKVVFEGTDRTGTKRADGIDVRIDGAYVGATDQDLQE